MAEVKNINGKSVDFDAVANLMDAEICEDISSKLAPCSEQEFFTAYETAHRQEYGEEWELSKSNPTW